MAAERPPHDTAIPGMPVSSPWLEAPQEEMSGGVPAMPYIGSPTSPATTVSLINQTLDDMLRSPSAAASPVPGPYFQDGGQLSPQPQDISLLFNKFAEMLDRGLSLTAARITSDIKSDLQLLGTRIESIETKMDSTIDRVNQNTDRFQELHDQLEGAMAKIDDLENRSRRLNFRIRGLPETVTDIPDAVHALIKHLIPDIRAHRLELDRAHRALGPPRSDGLPRDIVVKPHYYNVKDEIMRRARNTPQIQILGHSVQIFADISPFTIQKRRALKPLLTVLTQKNIKYWWLFPLSLKFELNGKTFRFSTLSEGELLLKKLGILPTDPPSPMQASSSGLPKRPPPTSPLTHAWQKPKHKKAKDGSTT